jgi:hypothetical protein
MKKMKDKIFDHLKILSNVAYCIVRNIEPLCDFESLLFLNVKLGVGSTRGLCFTHLKCDME